MPTVELTEERWREVLDSELTSTFLTIRTFLPSCSSARRVDPHHVVVGRTPTRQANLAYGVAKAGVGMLTRALATEIGPYGVRINAIAPSSIRTEKVAARMPPAVQEQVAAMHPLHRLGTTDDVRR